MSPDSSLRWVMSMAWRDSRGSRLHLMLSVTAIAIGIAALVAIRSFGDQLDDAVERQTRTLLGADYAIRALQPFTPPMESFLNTLPGEQVRETRFYSMVQFPASGGTRLSHVRALSAPYPFYGALEAWPPESATGMWEGDALALVEESLLIQFGADIGDAVQIGAQTFTIAGRLLNVSGEAPATSTFIGPRIYISMRHVPDTELIRDGSLARHYAHFKLPPDIHAETIRRTYASQLAHLRLEMETAEQRKALMGNTLANLNRYLQLGGFVALLLGGIGLAGAVHLYVRKKQATVSILRCLGASARTAFAIYLVQTGGAALIGALLGALTGAIIQFALPMILSPFIPLSLEPGWSWSAIATGLWLGVVLAAAFALFPLMPLRRVPPLAALRPDAFADTGRRIDWAQCAVCGLLAVGILAFAWLHTDRWTHALGFALALAMVFVLLIGLARLLMFSARRVFREHWPFVLRQGLANIHRPYNQTAILLLALGLGAFLLATLSLTQENLVRHFRQSDQDGRPNTILFDIQPDQVAEVEAMVAGHELERLETTPIVTMRLVEVDGRSVGALRDDPERDIPHWVLFREYRSTYREHLQERDRLIAGAWVGRVPDRLQPIPVSIDQSMADLLGIGLGNRLVFDVQGVRLNTVVRSLRQVDWRQMRTNFFVIFPTGVLESAPQYLALVTRTPSPEMAARLQQDVVSRYPNISIVDLRMVVQSIDNLVDHAAFVVRFMALFSVFTGLLVLGGTVVVSRYDRVEESALLRTLGATRRQLNRIMAAEYVTLGLVSSVSGLLLAVFASWAIARWIFDISYWPATATLIGIPLAVTLSALAIGWICNRSVSTA